jgi:hypothetical protein
VCFDYLYNFLFSGKLLILRGIEQDVIKNVFVLHI